MSIVRSVALVLVALLLVASAPVAGAAPTESPRHEVSADLGFDSAFTLELGYAHTLGLVLGDHPVRLPVRLTLPLVMPDLADLAVTAGLRATPLAHGGLRLEAGLAFLARNAHNALGDQTAFGLDLELAAGWRGRGWAALLEAGWDKTLAVLIDHSASYRTRAFADAKDGLYASTGGTVRVGLRGEVRLTDAVVLRASAGLKLSEGGTLHTPPFYFDLGVGVGL